MRPASLLRRGRYNQNRATAGPGDAAAMDNSSVRPNDSHHAVCRRPRATTTTTTTTTTPMVTVRRCRRPWTGGAGAGGLLILSSLLIPLVAAADCISLSSSTTCPAFKDSEVSTSDALVATFPFLQYVSSTTDFDKEFTDYISKDYAKTKYQTLFGCNNLTLSNTTDLYARFTKTVLCSEMVQNSKNECTLSENASTPVCADTCAQFAKSEQIIVSSSTCGNSSSNAMDEIRSDFTVCGLPSKSLDNSCIEGEDNESLNCGFNQNLPGMCLYCSDSTVNSTDTCCYNANAQTRCVGVQLPNVTSDLPPITVTTTSTATATAAPSKHSGSGLSGGAIAGITIGSLAAAALIAFALLYFCRRKQYYGADSGAVFNRPTGAHRNPSMSFNRDNPATAATRYEVLPGGRVARMSALEDGSGHEESAPPPIPGVMLGRIDNSSSSDFGLEDSPNHRRYSPQHRPLNPPPPGRNTSLSNSSIFLSDSPHTPTTGGEKSPDYGSPASEQLAYFKDYYSSEDIRPGDKVATLWAYQPRADDEFELERGDVLRIVGIWDDGWATGVRLPERAEDLVRRRELRDSGVSASQTSRNSQRRASSPIPSSEVKAFPLVCVCLPEHWQKTIESDIQGATGDPRDEDDGESSRGAATGRRVGEKSSSRFKEDLNIGPPP